ncbi:MAG TPA: AsmA-like C-terminal region-containing protein, partial [Candidatus Binatia bacterium]|nr:AsmA-like C-terminal region-containing protein [Candidatus Binatia bacterium]
TVTAPVLAVAKPPGAPGSAEVRIALVRGVATRIERFAVSAGGASVTGRAGLGAGGSRLETLETKAIIEARDAAHPLGHLTLDVRRDRATHVFVLRSDDAGALFRAFGAGTDATGGRLRYAGTVGVGTAGMPLDGHLEVHDFTLLRSPLLARLTTLSSLSGIANLLQNRGVRFDRLDAGISNRDRTVTIADAVASGRSVNVNVSGTIDRGDWTTSLRGTLKPSYYGLNAAAGRVPFVGKLITGQGGVLQAFEFEVSGPLAAPRVSVDPLRSVAPGALRHVGRRATAIRR